MDTIDELLANNQTFAEPLADRHLDVQPSRSLAISQRRLGTREIMLIHHTDCGMEKITDEGFRVELEEATGILPEFPIQAFKSVDDSVRISLDRVRRSPFIPHREAVRGFVYDVDTHRLREVE